MAYQEKSIPVFVDLYVWLNILVYLHNCVPSIIKCPASLQKQETIAQFWLIQNIPTKWLKLVVYILHTSALYLCYIWLKWIASQYMLGIIAQYMCLYVTTPIQCWLQWWENSPKLGRKYLDPLPQQTQVDPTVTTTRNHKPLLAP